MPRIRVHVAPVMHRASGFIAWEPGDYAFADDSRYQGWLQGQVERGNVSLLPEDVGEESEPPEGEADEGEVPEAPPCAAITQRGTPCRGKALTGGFCMAHASQAVSSETADEGE